MQAELEDDPLARLERDVRRRDDEKRAEEALRKARVTLIRGQDAKSAFFAMLALRLELACHWEMPTAATDGKLLKYNPEFVLGLSEEAQVTLVAHEVLHLALSHHARREHRDPKTWNAATDLACNPLLQEAGFLLPPGAFVPAAPGTPHEKLPRGLSAEQYYDLLTRQEQQDGQPEGEGEQPRQEEGRGPPDPGGMGAVDDAGDGSPAAQRESEADWEVATAQAAQAAQKRGNLPAGLARFIEEMLHPRPDVAEVLRQFVSQAFPADYTWSKPSRRALAQGVYRPGLGGEDLGVVVMAVDTSGSICPQTLKTFGDQMQGVLEAYPGCKLVILYHDAKVCAVQQWTPEDGPLVMTPAGGGGTSHVPVFDWIAEHPELEAACLVCLTDMYSHFPDLPPGYPVLWASTSKGIKQPFGQLVEID